MLAVFGFSGWELIEKDEFDNVRTLLSAATFDELLQRAVSGGYLRPPIAVRLGEMPR
jgi:hypothetical protein